MSSDPPPPLSHAPRRTAAGPPRGLRVLIADGHADAADSLAALLEIWGHEPVVARDGPSAVGLLGRETPDVVVVELVLPRLGGWDVARWVRSRPELAAVRLVALTAQAREDDRRRSREVGIDVHLVKPCDPNELERVLDAFRR